MTIEGYLERSSSSGMFSGLSPTNMNLKKIKIKIESKLKTELEAQAKVLEANGIAKAQAIIKQDLTHEYLVYLWIEALKESAKHNNATIYIPTDSNGLPFFKSIGVNGKK